MELKDAIELAEKLVGTPYYYTESEETISIIASVLAAFIGFFVVRRMLEQSNIRTIISTIVLVIVSIGYYNLREVGGVFWLQTACRVIICLALTFLIPYSREETP